jgi:hypothetical protein
MKLQFVMQGVEVYMIFISLGIYPFTENGKKKKEKLIRGSKLSEINIICFDLI